MEELNSLVNNAVESIYPEVRELQESIHSEPELSNEENRTREKVKAFLKDTKVEIRECKRSTGLICDLKVGENLPTIAFRADMDALSIGERTDLSYGSTFKNAMHACGHDFHTSILAGSAKLMSLLYERLKVNVRFIFQPAEENNPEGGAKRMIEEGALSGCSAIFGLHLWPELNTGQIGLKRGPLFAASDKIRIKITGKSAHAAKPEAGTDAVVIAGHIIVAIQTAISRGISPFDEAVVTIGRMEGGTRYNIIAEEAELFGTVRNTSSEVRKELRNRLASIVKNTAEMFGGSAELDYADGFPVLVNNSDLYSFASEEVQALEELGIKGIKMEHSSMVAEDFSYYALEIPGFFMLLGSTAPGTDKKEVFPLHSPYFRADQKCIKNGLLTFAKLAMDGDRIPV
jgi:amidohydrolase